MNITTVSKQRAVNTSTVDLPPLTMLIACIADIHDRVDNLDKVLDEIEKYDPEVLICCGDFFKASVMIHIARRFSKEFHFVYGNLDDPDQLKTSIDRERLLHVYFHQLQGRLTFDKKKIAFTHKPRDAESLLNQGFDVVFYGHTHESRVMDQDGTLLVNPGDVQGRFNQPPSFALYDTAKGTATVVTVT